MESHLKKKELVSIDRDARGVIVSCLNGAVWLAQNGGLNDHLILSGMSFTVSCKGKIVMLALNSATLMFNQVTQNKGIACKGKDIFCKITEAIPMNRRMWRCTIGQS